MKDPMTHTDSSPSDSDLVRAALAGDAGSLGTLIERHFGTVYAVALARLRDPETAEDLAQEVFLRAQLHLGQLGPAGNFPAWVARIARNLAIDWLLRGNRASRLLPMVPLDAVTHGVHDTEAKGARETMAAQEETQALRRAIMELATEQREVVLLHFCEDLSQQEIAGVLGVSQATVSRQIQRALKSLRGMLELALREVAPALRAPRGAVARSMLIASAVGAISASAKASLAASASVGPLATFAGTVNAADAGAVGVIGFFKSLPALIAAGGKIMATGKGIAVATVVLIAGGIGYQLTRPQGTPQASPNMGAQLNNGAAAVPMDRGEPVTLWVDLEPGTRWTSTERTVTQRGPAMDRETTVTIVTDHQVLNGAGDDAVRVESVIRDVMMEADGNGQPANAGQAGGRDVAEEMRGVRRLETIDRHGRVISSEVSTGESADPVLQALGTFDRSVMTELPDHPVRPGEFWQREVEVPGARGVTAACESTLTGVEETRQGPVAMISRTVTIDIASPPSLPISQRSRVPNMPAEIETTITRFHGVSRIDSRLLLSEGQWLSHAAQSEADMDARVRMELPPAAGGTRETDESRRERRTTTIEIEH
jgi:RNA polymerase sigma-70 factor (ECF subfamily)